MKDISSQEESVEPQENKIYVEVKGLTCPECKGVLLDYNREDDDYFWCLNADCNTFKVLKTSTKLGSENQSL